MTKYLVVYIQCDPYLRTHCVTFSIYFAIYVHIALLMMGQETEQQYFIQKNINWRKMSLQNITGGPINATASQGFNTYASTEYHSEQNFKCPSTEDLTQMEFNAKVNAIASMIHGRAGGANVGEVLGECLGRILGTLTDKEDTSHVQPLNCNYVIFPTLYSLSSAHQAMFRTALKSQGIFEEKIEAIFSHSIYIKTIQTKIGKLNILDFAFQYCSSELAKSLLAHGADPSRITGNPYHLPLENSFLILAANKDEGEESLKLSKDLLHRAIKEKNAEVADQILELGYYNGQVVYYREGHGYDEKFLIKEIFLAIENEDDAMIEVLRRHGATFETGYAPLEHAARYGHFARVRQLLDSKTHTKDEIRSALKWCNAALINRIYFYVFPDQRTNFKETENTLSALIPPQINYYYSFCEHPKTSYEWKRSWLCYKPLHLGH